MKLIKKNIGFGRLMLEDINEVIHENEQFTAFVRTACRLLYRKRLADRGKLAVVDEIISNHDNNNTQSVADSQEDYDPCGEPSRKDMVLGGLCMVLGVVACCLN